VLGRCRDKGCCQAGSSCLTPDSNPILGTGDPDVSGTAFYGANPKTTPYSICAPDDISTAKGALQFVRLKMMQLHPHNITSLCHSACNFAAMQQLVISVCMQRATSSQI
jgi:hypothetical protein